MRKLLSLLGVDKVEMDQCQLGQKDQEGNPTRSIFRNLNLRIPAGSTAAEAFGGGSFGGSSRSDCTRRGHAARWPEITARRMHIETMESVLGGVEKVLVDPGSAGLLPYLPLNLGGGTKP